MSVRPRYDSSLVRRYWTLAVRGARLLRAPGWRRRLRRYMVRNVEPLLVSERGQEHLSKVLENITVRLSSILTSLNGGPAVLDESRFANGLSYALHELTFCPEITTRGAKVRAYCDINATMVVADALLREIAAELSAGELDVATRLANAGGSGREWLLAAGRRMLEAGRHEDAASYARRALDIMTACPLSQKLLMEALRRLRNDGGTLTDAEENGLADLRGRFCPRPFEVIVSGQGVRWNEATGATEQVMGSTYACDCAAWVPFVTGNMLEGESAEAVWNSPGVQEVRRSVLDGDFSYCSRTLCPFISNGVLPRADEITTPRLRQIIDNHETVVADGPRIVALGHDSSCNLACPTCRNDLMMANREQSEKLDRARDRVILPMLRNRQSGLQMTSWGDPFASRHYRSILEALRAPEFDGIRLFMLTNGLGLTAQTWKAMPHLADKIVELRVSVDAATKQTYENVRRPGRWEVIRENLGVMAEMSLAGTFHRNAFVDVSRAVSTDLLLDMEQSSYRFTINFVVQSDNFREMPAFVQLAEELGAGVVFQKYYSFGHEAAAIFTSKDITSSGHPEHAEFQAILRHPAMSSPRVLNAFLTQFESRTA